MTSPTSVGEVSVEVVAELKNLTKRIRKDFEEGFRKLDIGKAIRESMGTRPVRVQVEADVDTADVTRKIREAGGVTIPVDADLTSFRAKLAELARRARVTVKADVDVDRNAIGRALGGGSALGGIGSALAAIGRQATSAASAIVGFGGSAAGAANTALGPVGAVVSALALLGGAAAAVAGGFTIAVPAISAFAGAVAALPGLLSGVAAGIGALSLGFQGISAAFKPKAGGGGGGGGGEDPAARARRIAGAERGVEAARRGIAAATRGVQSAERGYASAVQALTDAQKRAAQAQGAINKARREAKEDIEDLTRSLAGARLNEEDAALAVTEALRELNKVKLTGDLPDIQRADLEYRQAVQTLEEAKDTTGDLAEEQADAAKKGVDGSDKVASALADQVDALRAVEDAQEGVLDAQKAVLSANDSLKSSYDGLASAQDSLAEAQKKASSGGGGGGALGEVVKLAPAAQKFVNAIKALKPAFEDLRLGVQQKLFAGLDKTVTKLGEAWIPALKTTLGNYATTFNGFFKDLGASVTTPKFIGDIQAGAEGARRGFAKIGDSITTSLVPAFGALSRAAGPFLDKLGEEIAAVVTEFSNWVLEGEKTGSLKDFFDSAAASLHDIFNTGKLVTKIVGKIVAIIAGRELKGDSGKTPLQQFNEALDKVSEWLDDPAHQEGLRQFFEKIITGFQEVSGWVKKIDGWITKIEALRTAITGGDEKVASQSGTAAGAGVGSLAASLQKAGMAPASGAAAGSSAGTSTGDGFFSGLKESLGRAFGQLAGLLWSGPGSLIGRIKAGLGIASPSTVTAEIGRNLVEGLIQGIGGMFADLKAKARELPTKIREGIGVVTGFLTQKGKDFVTGLKAGIGQLSDSVRTKAGELKTKARDGLSGANSWLTTKGQEFVTGLKSGISSRADQVRTTAATLKTKASDAFKNAGTLLRGIGQAITDGLQGGIASRVPSLGSYLNRLADYIRANKGPIEKDRVMLFGAGQAIMGGLVDGLADRRNELGRELADITSTIEETTAAAMIPQLGVAGDVAIARSLTVASTADQPVLRWAPGTTGDALLDAMRARIQITHRGNVSAALGSG